MQAQGFPITSGLLLFEEGNQRGQLASGAQKVFHQIVQILGLLLKRAESFTMRYCCPWMVSGSLNSWEQVFSVARSRQGNTPRDMTDSPFPPLKKRGELGCQSLHSRPLFSFFRAQSTQRNLLVCQKLNENPCSPL